MQYYYKLDVSLNKCYQLSGDVSINRKIYPGPCSANTAILIFLGTEICSIVLNLVFNICITNSWWAGNFAFILFGKENKPQ